MLGYGLMANTVVMLSWRCTNENPSLQTLWQYGLRFRVEELFLDSKSGVFQLEDSKIRNCKALERLYLIVAIALLFATCHGMTLQLKGLRTQVDPHWKRGLSYLKIGLRWLKGVLHKGRDLFFPNILLSQDIQPCFASLREQQINNRSQIKTNHDKDQQTIYLIRVNAEFDFLSLPFRF